MLYFGEVGNLFNIKYESDVVMNECQEIKNLHSKLLKKDYYFFPEKGTSVKLCKEQGVYIIYGSDKITVLHVGTTKTAKGGINQRLNDHRNGNSSFSKKYLKPNKIKLSQGNIFRYIVVDDARKRVFLEALTIGLLCPLHIGTGERN